MIGLEEWSHDDVVADGSVLGSGCCTNKAQLAFNYEATRTENPKPLELEVLHYTRGRHWLEEEMGIAFDGVCVSHIGMHVTAEELDVWKSVLTGFGLKIAQEVKTQSHTNQFLLDNGRKYHYTIFGARHLIGFDLKLIVRIEKAAS